MATTAATPTSVSRQPFAELSGHRLQRLTSIKNSQNALSGPTIHGKSPLSQVTKASPQSSLGKKRSFEPVSPLDSFDSENVDPLAFLSPTKKTKSGDGITKPTSFTFASSSPLKVSEVKTPLSSPSRATHAGSKTPSTAPVGRSPPRKARIVDPKRRLSSPYTRIDPPSSARKAPTDALPFFSFEEALAGTKSRTSPSSASVSTELQRGMPKSWFFSIHEDTPDQEAQNLMEHHALILDISSDEESSRAKLLDCGKENIDPTGANGIAITAPSTRRSKKGKGIQRRRKIVGKDEMDDGERSPLSEVEREDFFPEGTNADAVIVVDGEDAATKPSEPASSVPVASSPVVSAQGDVVGDIVIFEDAE